MLLFFCALFDVYLSITQLQPARTYIGLTKRHNLDDSHSESSGEMTTSDSGRGGSEEDIRSSMTISHDTGSTNCLSIKGKQLL
jgi:hypothetical protein